MKPLPKKSTAYLFDHLIDGFKATFEGLKTLVDSKLIDEQEYRQQLEKNTRRLIDRIEEFKIKEKIFCAVFIALFTMLQVMPGTDMDMRRGRRSRRRSEHELISDKPGE